MTLFFLKIVGFLIVTAIAAFGGVVYVNASKLEKEIEAEIRQAGDVKEK